MKITQFKEMLSVHGADFSRWEGVDQAEAKQFMESSDQAKKLYEEARTLDAALGRFAVDAVSPEILDTVMARIGGGQDNNSAKIHKLEPKQKKEKMVPRPFARPLVWGGALAAVAAAVVVYISMPSPDIIQTPAIDNQVVLAEVDAFVEEEIERQELMELWQLAEARVAEQEQEIDKFLNELFEEPAEESEAERYGPEQEQDLWDLFLEMETQEL